NLRDARADVDVDDPAVRAGRRTESLGFSRVRRENRRREPLRDAVVDRHGLFEGAIADQIQDGREGLTLDDGRGVADLDYRRTDITAAGRHAVRHAATAVDDEI